MVGIHYETPKFIVIVIMVIIPHSHQTNQPEYISLYFKFRYEDFFNAKFLSKGSGNLL